MSSEPTTFSSSRTSLVVRGGVVAYIVLLVVLPLGALTVHGLKGGLSQLWSAVSSPEAADALVLTLWTAALVTVINAVMGTATAWVLVRFRFPGRRLIGTIIDLPLAIPTLVTGIMLVVMLGPASPAGGFLEDHGVRMVFDTPAIVLALAFVSFPFSVRTVEPVLRELDPAEEEAAETLGARPLTTFLKVVLPALLPAVASGAMQCFARAIAEFGSIIVVSGNIPHSTLTAPVYVFGDVESGRSELAAGVSIVLLALALAMTVGSRLAERFAGNGHD
jgi:sulfate transport system permease protein